MASSASSGKSVDRDKTQIIKAWLECKKSSGAASVNGNLSSSDDEAENDFIDINGDGLPDMVYKDGSVRFNKGYAFSDKTLFGHEALRKTIGETKSAGGGVDIPVTGYVDVSFGCNFTSNENQTDFDLIDVDGDGLPDMVKNGSVAFNNGIGLDDFVPFDKVFGTSKTTGTSTYGNVAVPINFRIVFIKFFITPRISRTHSEAISRSQKQLLDIDGNGYSDIVSSDNNSQIKVRRNLWGRTNLIKNVTLPYGSTFAVDYQRIGNTFNMPQSKLVLKEFTIEGGDKQNGSTRFKTRFEYSDGYYNRKERDFYGFKSVKTISIDTDNEDKDYKVAEKVFDNKDYNLRYMPLKESVTLFSGDTLSVVLNNYGKTVIFNNNLYSDSSVFTFLTSATSKTFNLNDTKPIVTKETYKYDSWGNIGNYTTSAAGESLTADISYLQIPEKNIYTVAEAITVKDQNGNITAKRTAKANSFGEIIQISSFTGSEYAGIDLQRDQYGNVTKLTMPENVDGKRFFTSYTYDNIFHSLITSVTDAFGYTSSSEYDYKFKVPTKTIDINGKEMRFEYDIRGRLTKAVAPNEIENGDDFTVKIEYFDNVAHPYTVTHNFDPLTGGNQDVYVFADNLLRPVQTKKYALVRNGAADDERMIVSGLTVYDCFGRKTTEYQPFTEDVSNASVFNSSSINKNPTFTEYDLLDRPVKITLPDGSENSAQYSFVDYENQRATETVNIDAEGRKTVQINDAKGRNRENIQYTDDGQEVKTICQYDAAGKLLDVTHPDGFKTSYTYDLLGHKLSVAMPDNGLTTFTYDLAGNLITKQTDNLKKNISDDAAIRYYYDYNRLKEIVYPKNIYNCVTFTYGDPGAEYNRAGRLALVEDASGGTAFYYDNLGNASKNRQNGDFERYRHQNLHLARRI